MRCYGFAALRAGWARGEMSRSVLPIAKVVGIGLLLGGCASSHASYTTPSNVGMQPAPQVAIVAPKVEVEDDGLAVQAPPRVRKQLEPDDPSEPFSPNYGPSPEPGEPAATPVRRQQRADIRPLRFRSRVTPMTHREAENVVVRAMIAHEMRYQ